MIDYNNFEVTDNDRYFLGVDQSLVNTGITLYDRELDKPIYATTISTDKFSLISDNINSIEVRLYFIIKEVERILDTYKVDVVCMEGLAFNVKTNTARQLTGLFFGLLLMFLGRNVKYFIVAPKSLKMVATLDGNASKVKMYNCIDIDTIKTLKSLAGFVNTTTKFYDIVDSYHLSKYILLRKSKIVKGN